MRVSRGSVIAAASFTGAAFLWGVSIDDRGHVGFSVFSCAAATLTIVGCFPLMMRAMRSQDREALKEDRAALIRTVAEVTQQCMPARPRHLGLARTLPLPRVSRDREESPRFQR